MTRLFSEAPQLEFRPAYSYCPDCKSVLAVQKTHTRMVSTLDIGKFQALEVVLICPACKHTYHSEELGQLVPPGANFGYDILVYVGKAFFLRYRTEQEVMTELAEKNVQISSREASLLGMKFIVYLAIAQQQHTASITADMQLRGGFVCHLDSTCEGGDPFLMSSIDSLSEIVLGNIKIPSEHKDHIVPFLQSIKASYGIPLALVHDMSRGIIKAVAEVFPGVPDYICHFHFLRDIGIDYMGGEYDTIRTRLSKHQINGKLLTHAKKIKGTIDWTSDLIDVLATGLSNHPLPTASYQSLPAINCYTYIQWALQGKSDGQGYGFPFDRPYLAFANRLRCLHADMEKLSKTQLRGKWKDNMVYFKVIHVLNPVMQDKALWRAVETLEKKITVFEKLRQAMRIALQTGRQGLNDEGQKSRIITIEQRVKKFRVWLTSRKDYAQNQDAKNMINQIDTYWKKLFAKPIIVQTPTGVIHIQPQRTNNILEQMFRHIKRANRRKTGNASSSRILRTMLAQTPLARNLSNPNYMKIMLAEKKSLEEVFAGININTFRNEFSKARSMPGKIPAKLKALIAMTDYPEKLAEMMRKAAA